MGFWTNSPMLSFGHALKHSLQSPQVRLDSALPGHVYHGQPCPFSPPRMQSFVSHVRQTSRSLVRNPAAAPIEPTVPASAVSGQM